MKYLLYFAVAITLTNDSFCAVHLIDDICLAACLVLVVSGTYVIIPDDIGMCLN